jgi:ATP-dependent helicase Lhr and Lhr-like helicase
MNDRHAQQRQLKEKLPHSWDALFARFGRFTEIQTRAIEPLLAGRNCVLVSATASGKTEAALAPLIELHKQDKQAAKKLSLLYLVPTRALARDLARRLAQPLEKLAVGMRVKTGDEPALNANRPPELLLTTPESLDSLLANAPRLLKDVRAVVLDELHIFDNTVRGDQLRILLNRLRRLKRYALTRGDVASEAVQYCALSATIHDPASVAARYFNDPLVLQVAGQRAIDAEVIELDGPETLIQLFAGLQRRGCKKALAFCPSRAECEEWAYRLRPDSPFGDCVYVHHASLAASVRRAVERNFAHADAALCFATSTLELGIDIGDVDLIVLIGAPNDQGAFLQRIGRGNRRTARTAVVCCHRNPLERALFQVFLRAAESGIELDTSQPYFFRPSVIVQQLCSYIKQNRLGELDPDGAYELFTTLQGAPLIAKTHYEQIVEHLLLKQFFVTAEGRTLKPGPAWQELFEQRAIYTNLLDVSRRAVEIVEEETGRRLGEVERRLLPGEAMLFGGHARQAIRMVGRKLMVRTTDASATARPPRLFTPWRPLSPALALAVAAELGVPRAADPAALAMVIEEANEEEDAEVQLPTTWLFHCAGEAYGLILGDLLEARYRVRVEDYNELYVAVKGTLPAPLLEFTAAQVQGRLRQRWKQLESWYSLGRFQNLLPLAVRRVSVVESFDIAAFLRAFNGRKLVPGK